MTKDELKQAIMHVFEQQNRRVNEIIPMRYWYYTFLRSLNPKEQELFESAVNELIDERKIIYETNGLECLRLTELGYADLYHNSKSQQDIENEIMNIFKNNHLRAGEHLPVNRLEHEYYMTLNPVERGKYIDACDNLINKQYIAYNENRLKSFVLQKAGYDYLYDN